MITYHELVREIADIQTKTEAVRTDGTNRTVIDSRWQIGKRIVENEQGGETRAEYGQKLLQRLSADLSKKFATGFSLRCLADMRKFYNEFNKSDLRYELSWSHYRTLLSIEDARRRQTLMERAIAKGLSWTELETQIRRENKESGRYDGKIESLTPPTGKLYHYFTRSEHDRTYVDLGFTVWRELPEATARELAGVRLVHSAPSGPAYSVTAGGEDGDPWYYAADVVRVIDGDTLLLRVDLGFGLSVRQRVRLKYVDAPELDEKGGPEAKAFLERALKKSPRVFLKSWRTDKYDRYLGDVVAGDGGRYLNRELLEEGLAGWMRG